MPAKRDGRTRRAIGLLRVSTEAQGDDGRGGLPSQRAEIHRVAEREGLELAEWVELRGVSGAQVREDPRFVSLLARLSEPDLAGVAVADFDRLFRRHRFADYAILDAFAETGSLLFTAQGAVDPREDSDALLSVLRGEIAGQERRRIAERTQRAKEVHRRAGRHVAGWQALPYGVTYRTERGPGGEPRPAWGYAAAEAAVVREVYRRVLAGERNFTRLAAALGIERTLVPRILRNPVYAGVRRIDRRVPGRRPEPRAAEDVIETDLTALGLEPLVSREAWRQAQRILGERRPPPKDPSDFPGAYHGVAECGPCERALHAHHERRGATPWSYRCRSQARGGGCATGGLAWWAVDREADRVIRDRLAHPEVIAEAFDVEEPATCSNPQVAAPGDFEALRAERQRVLTAYERGLRTLESAEARVREIDARLELLAAQAARPEPVEDPEALAVELATPFAEWSLLETDEKRRVLASAVEAVEIERAGRARARVRAVRLWVPAPESPVPPNGPSRALWGVWGDVLRVSL